MLATLGGPQYGRCMADLPSEIAAFAQMQSELEMTHLGKWVVFHNRALAGAYDTFEQAAKDAVSRFGRGPYLIRQVGASSGALPASLAVRPAYAGS